MAVDKNNARMGSGDEWVYWPLKQAGKAYKKLSGHKDVSVTRERSTRSTSTAGQKARLAAAARTGKVQSQRGVSARRNAADISMNNPPVVTNSGGHRVNPKTGKVMHSRRRK